VLRRELGEQINQKITAVTCGEVSATTHRLGQVLSAVLELPFLEAPHNLSHSMHLRDNGKITEIVVRSLTDMRDLGPRLGISKLIWSV